MALSNSNLFSESYSILKSFLQNNIRDPKRRFKANWIHPSMPNVNAKGFDGYPFIVVRTDASEDMKSFDRTSQKTFRATITIYSDDASQVDTISNSIYANIQASDLEEFKAIELSGSPLDFNLDMNGKKIIYRTIGLICRSRL